jgi:hypothetical protein
LTFSIIAALAGGMAADAAAGVRTARMIPAATAILARRIPDSFFLGLRG